MIKTTYIMYTLRKWSSIQLFQGYVDPYCQHNLWKQEWASLQYRGYKNTHLSENRAANEKEAINQMEPIYWKGSMYPRISCFVNDINIVLLFFTFCTKSLNRNIYHHDLNLKTLLIFIILFFNLYLTLAALIKSQMKLFYTFFSRHLQTKVKLQ